MLNFFKIIASISIIALLYIFPSSAGAFSANVTYSTVVRVNFIDRSLWATEFNLDIYNDDGTLLYSSPGYCINIFATTYQGGYVADTYPISGYYNLLLSNNSYLLNTVTEDGLNYAAYVMENYSPTLNEEFSYSYAIAAQAVIWESLFDLDLNLNNNSPSVLNAYAAITSGSLSDDELSLYRVASIWREDGAGNVISHGQDLLIRLPYDVIQEQEPAPVPEPATMLMLSVGVLFFLYPAFKKNRRSAPMRSSLIK